MDVFVFANLPLLFMHIAFEIFHIHLHRVILFDVGVHIDGLVQDCCISIANTGDTTVLH